MPGIMLPSIYPEYNQSSHACRILLWQASLSKTRFRAGVSTDNVRPKPFIPIYLYAILVSMQTGKIEAILTPAIITIIFCTS